MRLKTRERELSVFLDGILMLKSAAAYTAGDLYALLALCRSNAFLALVPPEPDVRAAWSRAAGRFFTRRADCALAESFLEGFGKTDLEGQLAYMALFEEKTRAALEAARADSRSKCRLYAMLGFFSGTVAALLLV